MNTTVNTFNYYESNNFFRSLLTVMQHNQEWVHKIICATGDTSHIYEPTLGCVAFESSLRDGLQRYWAVCMHHSKADSAAADLV